MPVHEPKPAGDPERQLGRSIYAVFLLAIATAIVGPVLSYESDVSELDAITQAHLQREASMYAGALDRHLMLVHTELGNLAAHTALSMSEGKATLDRAPLLAAERGSPLVGAGLALLDTSGHVLWSDPAHPAALQDLVASPSRVSRLWTGPETVAPVLDDRLRTLMVPEPVIREGKPVASLVGFLDLTAPQLPLANAADELALFDSSGRAILPRHEAEWSRLPDLRRRVEKMMEEHHGAHLVKDTFGVAVPVGRTGLMLLLTSHQDAFLGPMRGRFVLQLVLVASVQFIAVLLLALFARRTYSRFIIAERRVREQATLAALGGAASLIAHEVKNSLNGLGAALSLLGSGGDPSLATRTMRGQIDRLRHLATSLLAFGKPQEPRRVSTDLRPFLAEVIASLRDLPEADEVEVSLADGPSVRVTCDPLFLGTALDNLLRNAIEAAAACKDMGRVASPRVLASIALSDSHARILIEDNAGGLDAHQRTRLYEPFVTTKSKGIGLGLTMAARAVTGQGGALAYEPIDHGSRFIVTLPLGDTP
jgi:signal transduction histidine kinase